MTPVIAFGFGGAGEIGVLAVYSIPLILTIFALVDLVQRQFRDQATKVIWALAILFFPCIGPLLYLFWGKNQAIN